MSILVQAWVYQHSEARLADRLVLLAIADEADDDGGSAFPSLRRIAHKARVSVGTVSDAVRRLEASGELEVNRPERTGRGHHNSYRVVMRKGSESEPFEEGNARPIAARLRAQTRGNARPRGDTYPLTQDQEKETRGELRLVEPETRATDAVARVFDAWRESTGHARARLDEKRRLLIGRALRDYPVEEVLAAVRGWEAVPFNRGENPDGRVYNDLGLLLRDAEHIERFRDAAGTPVRRWAGMYDFRKGEG